MEQEGCVCMCTRVGGFQGMTTAKVKGCGPVKQSLFQVVAKDAQGQKTCFLCWVRNRTSEDQL